MKISEYKELEEKVKNNDFFKSYKNINKLMFFMSIFGHISSIFLAYFLLVKIISSTVISSLFFAGAASVVMLIGLELLKSEVFDKFTIGYLREQVLSNKILPLMIFSLSLFGMSFYATINGAKEFSSKEKEIVQLEETKVESVEDSLTTLYSTKISKIENEIDSLKGISAEKDREQTDLAAIPQNRSTRQRIGDLKGEKAAIRSEIVSTETKLKETKLERDTEIQKLKDRILSKTGEEKRQNKSNTLFFIILSTIIEFLIIAGVYFNEYYKFRSYNEYRQRLEKDPNFQRWYLYNSILDAMITPEAKMNDKLDNIKNITALCKLQGINLLQKDLTEMLKLYTSLGILRTSGSVKYIAKTKEAAQELLKKHFGVE